MLREREAWFRNLADESPMMVWVADLEKKLSFVNKAWLAYRGLTLEEALGTHWIEEVHPDDLERVRKHFDAAYHGHKPIQIRFRIRHGSKTVLSKANPAFAPDGSFTGFIGSCADIQDLTG